MEGRKFIRQHAIIYETIGSEYFFYVSDFYCYEENLAVEPDGKIHFYRKEKDKRRDEILEPEGIKVLRFKNEELEDIEIALERIKQEFK